VKAVVLTKPGGPEVLQVQDLPDPPVGPGEVRVATKAAGINFADLMARVGIYPDAPPPPCVLGYEIAGEVESVGEGVEKVAVGDRVVGGTRFNGQAELVTVSQDTVWPLPDALSFEEGAAFPVNYATAYAALVVMTGVSEGERVLIHAAAGGVGHVAVQIAKARGAYVIGTASAAKHDFLRSLGADEVIDYRHQDFTEIEPVDVVFDTIGGEYAERSATVLKPGGVLVSIIPGNPGFDVDRAVDLGIRFELFGSVSASGAELALLPQLKVQIDHAVPLADAAKAHELVESKRTTGKVVLVP
jgi:NADPH:quinone reductase-like Zn-dependent oxidoreductase